MSKKSTNIEEPLNHLDSDIPKWFAIYTKYKCEKYVVDKLQKKGIHAYIPLLSVIKRYTRKTKHLKLPLINCYAFVHITKSEYVRVLETEYVSGFIKQRKNLISIPDREIELLKRIVGEIEEVQSLPLSMEPGTPVEIIGGNLTGLQGKLIKKQGKNTFVVALNTIGYQLEMVIDQALLSPLRNAVSSL
jgi:transcription antitermination factor NusG